MKKTILKYLPMFLAFFGYYLAMAFGLFFGLNFFSQEGIFLVEKGIIALHGVPPHLENIGLVYPPLPFVVNLPFAAFKIVWGPQVVGAFATALFSTMTFAQVKKLERGKLVETMFLIVLLVHPLILYGATLGSTFILYPLLMFAYMYFLINYAFIGKTFDLITAGLIIGLMVFVRYETLFVLLFIVPVLHIVAGGLKFRTGWGMVALFLMNLVPPIIAWLSWMYLNWLFTGDWLNFLRSPYAYFRNIQLYAFTNLEVLAARHSVANSLWMILSKGVLVFAPFFWAISRVRNFSFTWYFLSPLLAIGFAAFAGLSLATLDEYVILIPLTVLLLAFERSQIPRWHTAILVVLLGLSVPMSLWAMLNSHHDAEKSFAGLFLGNVPAPMFERERELAAFIDSTFRSGETILLDDANGYPIVTFTKNPRRFLMPYQYPFRSAVISPSSFVDALIVGDPKTNEGKTDVLNQFHHDIYKNGLPSFHLLMDVHPWRLYVREGQTQTGFPVNSVRNPIGAREK